MNPLVHARVDPKTHKAITDAMEKEDRSMSYLIAKALRQVFLKSSAITLEDRLRASIKKVKASK